jgi:hypothetical protein
MSMCARMEDLLRYDATCPIIGRYGTGNDREGRFFVHAVHSATSGLKSQPIVPKTILSNRYAPRSLALNSAAALTRRPLRRRKGQRVVEHCSPRSKNNKNLETRPCNKTPPNYAQAPNFTSRSHDD